MSLLKKKRVFKTNYVWNRIPFILASGSAQRKALLKGIGCDLWVMPPFVKEKKKQKETVLVFLKRLAFEKASSIQKKALKRFQEAVILGADTVVLTKENQLFGKPKNIKQARDMLKQLRGNVHQVWTSYCLLNVARSGKIKKVQNIVKTKVYFWNFSNLFLEQFLKTYAFKNKAGGYNAQGCGMSLIQKVTGSYTNVIGLPLAEVLLDFERLF